MKRTRKFLSLALVFALLGTLLTGCVYVQSESVIHDDGSGTLYYASGILMDEDTDVPEEAEIFEANGNRYVGTSHSVEFTSADEFNRLFVEMMDENGDATGNGYGLAFLKKNSDGSLTLIFDITPAPEETEESVELTDEELAEFEAIDLTAEEEAELEELSKAAESDETLESDEDVDTGAALDATMEAMMESAWSCYTFTFDRDIRQIAGHTSPVTIEGGKLTIELLKTTEEEANYIFAFQTKVAASVVPTKQKLTVDGVEKQTEIYNINGANYFKLRDMAALLNGTGAQFSVDYDAETNSIAIQTGAAYEPNGSELVLPETDAAAEKAGKAVTSAQSLTINGAQVFLAPYNIGGNNYFALRELGSALGFGVDYDEATATMLVSTAVG